MNTVFELANLLILPFWALLIVAPNSALCRRLLTPEWICAALCAVYSVLLLPHLGELLPLLMRPQLPQIQQLLSTPLGATLGWVHFLAFDLFVARWIWMQQQPRPWWLRGIFVLTLMFVPLGLLCFLGVRRWPRRFPALLSLAVAVALLLPACLAGLAFDARLITAMPAWAKPLKFALSILIYSLSLQAVLARVGESRMGRVIARTTAICLAVEVVLIVLQTARGTTSHFNVGTPFDRAVWALMGLAIAPVWVAAMGCTWLLLRRRELEPALGAALGGGMAVSCLGMGVGWIMAGLNAHTVGAPDGGPGLPLLGWSLAAGDLRVAHFLGMHALQALVLLWLACPRPAVVRCGVLLMAGWTVLLTRQALAAQPFFVFDAALWGWTGLSLGLVLWAARQRGGAVV